PAGFEPHDDGLNGARLGGDALHHRIVDGVRWALGEGGFIHAPKAAVALALPVRTLARGEDVLAEARHGIEPDGSAHGKDAAIPEIATGGEIFARGGNVGLFHEGFDITAFPGADI